MELNTIKEIDKISISCVIPKMSHIKNELTNDVVFIKDSQNTFVKKFKLEENADKEFNGREEFEYLFNLIFGNLLTF